MKTKGGEQWMSDERLRLHNTLVEMLIMFSFRLSQTLEILLSAYSHQTNIDTDIGDYLIRLIYSHTLGCRACHNG